MVGPEHPDTRPVEEIQGRQADLSATPLGDREQEHPGQEPDLGGYSQTLLNVFFDK